MDIINKYDNGSSAFKKFKRTPEKSLLRLFVDYVAAQQAENHTQEEIIECVKILRRRRKTNTTHFQSLVKDKLKHLLPVLLECNGDVNLADSESQTILHIFIKQYTNKKNFPESDPSTDRKVVAILLEGGASVNAVDLYENTPVHYAASNQRTDLVHMMLDTFTDVNYYRRTVLHTLVENYKEFPDHSTLEAIRTLMFKGANPSLADSSGTSAYELARDSCLIKVLETFEFDFSDERSFLSILRSADIWPDHYPEQLQHLSRLTDLSKVLRVRDENCKSTPLHYVANFNRIEAVQLFLDAGAEIDAECADGATPLHLSVMQGHLETAKYLIKRGANLHARDTIFNLGLMHMATFKNDDSMINFLVDQGLDVNDQGGNDFRPLHLAAFAGNDRVIKTLISHGADVDCRTREERWTPLHLIWLKRVNEAGEDVSWVIRYVNKLESVNVNYRGLFEASEEQSYSVILLVHADANPNARDVHFRTPLHLATSHFTNETMTTILENSARVDVKDDEYKSPLTNVIERGDNRGLKELLTYGADLDELDVNEDLYDNAFLRKHLWLLATINLLPRNFRRSTSLSVVDKWRKNFDWMEKDRQSEVEKMKTSYLKDGETSLFDFLRMGWRRRNNFAREVFSTGLEKEYPLYHVVIENSCLRAIRQKRILDLATSALSRIVVFDFPDICVEKILSFFSLSDMTGFIDVVDSLDF